MEFTSKMVEEIRSLETKQIDFQVSEEIKKRLFDTIISASVGSKNPSVAKMKGGLVPSFGKLNASIFFSGERASVEYASLINTCMVASSGFQDFFPSRMTVNPSNAIPLILAFAEGTKAKGHDLLKSIYISYKASGAFMDAFQKMSGKSESFIPITMGMAAGVGSLVSMDNDIFSRYLGCAISAGLGLNENLPFVEKCFPAMMAREISFLYKVANSLPDGKGVDLTKDIGGESALTLDFKTERVTRSDIRCNRVDGVLMSAVEAVLALREKLTGEILNLRIEIPDQVYSRNVSGKEAIDKLDAADLTKSLPYVIAHTHFYGVPEPSFLEELPIDKNIRDLVGKMKVTTSDDYTKLFPTFIPIRILYETSDGMFEKQVDLPLGHYRNPAKWSDLRRKSIRITGNEEYTDTLIEFVKNIEEKEIGELMEVINSESTWKKEELGTVIS